MQGIERVLLIAGTDEDNRLRQHQNVVDAAKRAGVQSIAYTSRALKDRNTLANKLMEGHFQTEDYIKESALNYIIFRNVLYMDTIPQFAGENAVDKGIYLPTGQGRVSFALRSDMGEAIANALLESDRNNRIYTLTGSESYSFEDVAATLSDLSGQEVHYMSTEKSAFEAQMKERGVPEMMIGRVTGFLTDIKNGQEEEVTPDLENLLGRKPASLKEGLKVLFKLWGSPAPQTSRPIALSVQRRINNKGTCSMSSSLTEIKPPVLFYPNFLNSVDDLNWFQKSKELEWVRDQMNMYGKLIPVPRDECLFGDQDLRYEYRGTKIDTYPWPDFLLEARDRIQALSGYKFNFVVGNRYRTGKDSIGWHSDNFPQIGKRPAIASLSLGSTRKFKLRHNDSGQTVDYHLESGSLLIMRPDCQEDWVHAVPKTTRPVGERINWTFRPHVQAIDT
jgi:NAD(P)H dehydrogenase (quinone)